MLIHAGGKFFDTRDVNYATWKGADEEFVLDVEFKGQASRFSIVGREAQQGPRRAGDRDPQGPGRHQRPLSPVTPGPRRSRARRRRAARRRRPAQQLHSRRATPWIFRP